jgi:hypothetical protein
MLLNISDAYKFFVENHLIDKHIIHYKCGCLYFKLFLS